MIIESKESKNLFDKILAMNDAPVENKNENEVGDVHENDTDENSHNSNDQMEQDSADNIQQTQGSSSIPDTSKPGEFIRWIVREGKPEITGSTLNDEVLLDSVLEIGARLKGKDRFDFFSKNCASFGYDMADLTRRVKTLEEGDIDKQADILEDIVKQNVEATKMPRQILSQKLTFRKSRCLKEILKKTTSR